MSDLELGPFRLASPFARGAMGEVWRAWHRDQRLPVALKVLTGTHARNDRYVRGFQNEVRAVASLDHPHIVTLLDVGTVDARAARASEGRLVEGSPWLAMEYASEGTLTDRLPTTWPEVRALLLAMLDALAHAHARGLVHRDLKPANLLFCGDRDPRPGLKLTDFGIAARFGEEDLVEPGAGTPAYMAPEQLMAEPEGMGPWTDLYSLGCLAWKLSTGKLPFDGMKRVQLVRAHLTREPPAFEAGMPVPIGFEGWLRCLLAKRPEDRPQRAADAAASLAALDDRRLSDAAVGGLQPSAHEEHQTTLGSLLIEELTAEATSEAPRVGRTVGPPLRVPDWRQPAISRPPALVGAGLGLFGLREAPLVGRVQEQDALWGELRAVHGGQTPRLVTVTGPTGTGKTRLATWFCRRADEVGAARILWVEPRTDDGAGGVVGTVARMLRVDLAPPQQREAHLAAQLGDELAATVRALLDGELEPAARHQVVARLIARAAGDRPVILCVDDAQWSGDDLDTCRALLELPARVLVLVAAQDEALAGRPEEARALEALPGPRLQLGPLPPPARRELVRALLGLQDDLASQVEARTGGNPLFAVQLVGDWVARGLLRVGERGFVLSPAASRGGLPEIPDNLHDVWLRRLEGVTGDLPPATGWDLEVAAALGPDVDDALWHTACDDPEGRRSGWERAGLQRRAVLVQRLLRARLAVEREEGWSFAHEMLRRSVIRQSQERGRWAAVCETCANAVRSQGGRRTGERIGRLLLEAGQPLRALRPLLDGVADLRRTSARDALALLAVAEHAAQAAALPPKDPLRGRLLVARGRVHQALDEPDEALRLAKLAQEAALASHPDPADRGAITDREPWTVHYREALDLELSLHLRRRQLSLARATFKRLAPLVRATGDPGLLGDLMNAQAGLYQGDLENWDQAEALLVEALTFYRDAGNRPDAIGAVQLNRAVLAKEHGKLLRAKELLEQALEQLGPRGGRLLIGTASSIMAEVHLRLGEVRSAEQVAARAIAVLDPLGHRAADARVVLGLARSAQGQHAEALPELRTALQDCVAHGRTDLVATAALAVGLVEARLGHWSPVHDRLKEAEQARASVPLDAQAHGLAYQLSTAAKAAGFPQLAARAAALIGR